jgi:predicted DNA-binding transcriptional regulator YafY
MRASRLLHMLLLLQNRGRMTSAQLARELEVTRRTILRDVDALTEAGLPVIVHQGNQGGIELGFNYRMRLTGLSDGEAEALGLILSRPMPELAALGRMRDGERARSKLLESMPDALREKLASARRNFRYVASEHAGQDPRVDALAKAVRTGKVVRIIAKSAKPRTVHPECLIMENEGWKLVDALTPDCPIPVSEWGDVNISAEQWR